MASASGHAVGADMYLHVQTKRAGKIKGEAKSPGHTDDIELVGWRWGVSTGSALGDSKATARRSYEALTIVKRIDAATTPLMSALASNDEVKELVLAMRRAGDGQEDYFTIRLKAGRIAGMHHEADGEGHTTETVTVAFTQVDVEYRVQRTSGLRGASTSFSDTLPTGE